MSVLSLNRKSTIAVLLALSLGIVAGTSIVYLVPVSLGSQTSKSPGGVNANCPMIDAWVTIRSADGFATYSQPYPGGSSNSIPMLNQYVLRPGSSGYLTMAYDLLNPENDTQGLEDYLTAGLENSVWRVNGTDLTAMSSQDVGISVSIYSVILVNSTYRIVTYQITANSSATYGTYLVGFRDICLGELITVGTSLYVGPLPWNSTSVIN